MDRFAALPTSPSPDRVRGRLSLPKGGDGLFLVGGSATDFDPRTALRVTGVASFRSDGIAGPICCSSATYRDRGAIHRRPGPNTGSIGRHAGRVDRRIRLALGSRCGPHVKVEQRKEKPRWDWTRCISARAEDSPALMLRLPAGAREVVWSCRLENGDERSGKVAVRIAPE